MVFYEKTYILELDISCFKTPSEKLNDLGQNLKVAVIQCYHVSSNRLVPLF